MIAVEQVCQIIDQLLAVIAKDAPTLKNTHVLVGHPLQVYDLATSGSLEWERPPPFPDQIFGLRVAGFFRGIPVLFSGNAPAHKFYLMPRRDIEAIIAAGWSL